MSDREDLRSFTYSIANSVGVGNQEYVVANLPILLRELPAVFEHDDIVLLQALHNLASQAYPVAPEPSKKLLQRVIDGKAQVIGSTAESTLTSQNVLASFLMREHDFARALPLMKEVMLQRMNSLGVDHPATLRTMNNVAIALAQSGHLGEAIDLEKTVLDARRIVLGDEAPETMSSLNNLADLYATAGERSKAIELFNELLRNLKRSGEVGSFTIAHTQQRIVELKKRR